MWTREKLIKTIKLLAKDLYYRAEYIGNEDLDSVRDIEFYSTIRYDEIAGWTIKKDYISKERTGIDENYN